MLVTIPVATLESCADDGLAGSSTDNADPLRFASTQSAMVPTQPPL